MPAKAINRYKNRDKEPFKTIYNFEKRICRSFTKFSKKIDYSKVLSKIQSKEREIRKDG